MVSRIPGCRWRGSWGTTSSGPRSKKASARKIRAPKREKEASVEEPDHLAEEEAQELAALEGQGKPAEDDVDLEFVRDPIPSDEACVSYQRQKVIFPSILFVSDAESPSISFLCR